MGARTGLVIEHSNRDTGAKSILVTSSLTSMICCGEKYFSRNYLPLTGFESIDSSGIICRARANITILFVCLFGLRMHVIVSKSHI